MAAISGAGNPNPPTTKFNIGGAVAKGVGIVGLGTVLYDAHKYGKIKAEESGKNQLADSACDAYINTKTLHSSSVIDSNLQNLRFKAEMNGSIFGGIRNGLAKVGGYAKGVMMSLADNIVPLALSAGSLVTKGSVSKTLATATTIYGAVRGVSVAFGIGKYNPIAKK